MIKFKLLYNNQLLLTNFQLHQNDIIKFIHNKINLFYHELFRFKLKYIYYQETISIIFLKLFLIFD